MFTLAGCGGGGPEVGDLGYVEGFLGGVMADEPRAALVGREVLAAGGSAADAAVAAYFSMAVTLPGGAGLGGGGVCLVYDPEPERVDAFEFLPREPARAGAKFSVPGNVRGMFAVHARYGVLTWSSLLLPAERLARDGHPISRAFARELDDNIDLLRAHPETALVFGAGQGAVDEAKWLQQLPLSVMITAIRVRGAGDFYQGQSARQFVEAVAQAGGALTLDDMRTYLPRLEEPLQAPVGDETLYIAGGKGALIAGRVWAMLNYRSAYADAADDGARAHLLAAASRRAYGAGMPEGGTIPIDEEAGAALMAGFEPDRRDSVAPDGAIVRAAASQNGASLVAVDRYGQFVACGYTMGRPFGTGILAPGTGILLAPAESDSTVSRPVALALINKRSLQTFLGAALGGGSPVSLATLPVDLLRRGVPFDAALAAPRLYDPAQPDTVFHEDALSAEAQARLSTLGYRLESTAPQGRINGFYCPGGLPRSLVCQFVNDPRGFGLSPNAN